MHDQPASLIVQRPGLDALVEKANQYIEAAKAAATRKGYASDLRDFRDFCTTNGLPYLPSTAETTALYAAHLAARAVPSTIKRRLAAITFAHRKAGILESPASPKNSFILREVLHGIKRTHGVAPQGALPILGDGIRRIARACPDSLLGIRDRALTLLGFAAGSRRSELASILEVTDLTFTERGLSVRLRRSKTDTEQAGRTVAIVFGEHQETCPVRALRAWLEAAHLGSGPVFRAVDRHGNVAAKPLSPRSVSKILKRAAARAGIDPARISSHSLRVGMVTTSASNGASERAIAETTGHRSGQTVRRYIRDADLFRDSASGRLGL